MFPPFWNHAITRTRSKKTITQKLIEKPPAPVSFWFFFFLYDNYRHWSDFWTLVYCEYAVYFRSYWIHTLPNQKRWGSKTWTLQSIADWSSYLLATCDWPRIPASRHRLTSYWWSSSSARWRAWSRRTRSCWPSPRCYCSYGARSHCPRWEAGQGWKSLWVAWVGIRSFGRRPRPRRSSLLSFPRSIFDYWNWKSQSTCYGKGSRRLLLPPPDPSFAIGLKSRGKEKENQ